MTTPRIIGLTGLEGAGKDTVAGILQQRNLAFPIAFADTLRQEVCEGFDCPLHALTCRAIKEQPCDALALWRCVPLTFAQAVLATHPDTNPLAPQSPRQIMRWWGTEYRRTQDPNYWINKLRTRLEWADGIPLPMTTIVITDVRFANEAALVRELGGQIWQIHRPGHTVAPGHISTTCGQEFAPDQTVINEGSLVDLARAVLQHWAHAPLYWK